jgi:hypothetical protein
MATALASPIEACESIDWASGHAGAIEAAMAGKLTILDLLDNLAWFKTGADWTAWRAFLAALYGLPMTEREYEIYRECTGRSERSDNPPSEAWLAVGRRGRKSAVAALIGLWSAAYRMDYGAIIAKGETPTVPILSRDKYFAGQVRDHAKGIIQYSGLSYLLAGEPSGDVIPLLVPAPSGPYRVDLVIRAATIVAARSKTVLGAILDEVAFFRSDESVNPDREIIRGMKPGMSTIPGALLLGLSSPYARRGVLWEKYQEHYGKPGPVLFWQAPTLAMHDTPQVRAVVADAYDEDAISARAEYGAEFRSDVEVFINHEVVNAATAQGITERAPKEHVVYHGFVDPAGGTGDSFTFAVSHWDGTKAVLDALYSWAPPFDPGDVVNDVVAKAKPYRVRFVTGDHWAGEWPTAMFRRAGLTYYANAEPKSDIYRELLPVLNSGLVSLLDLKVLRQQLVGLDRRTARSGKDSIDHAPGAHDDEANAACGALLLAYKARTGLHLPVLPTKPELRIKDGRTVFVAPPLDTSRPPAQERQSWRSRGGGY